MHGKGRSYSNLDNSRLVSCGTHSVAYSVHRGSESREEGKSPVHKPLL